MKNDFYKFTMEADKTKAARLDLFGNVGNSFWEDGFDEKSFSEAMKDLGEEQALDVYINSPGGSVYTGISILNLLKKRKGAVCIYVVGLAASAATLITSAPNAKVVMPTGSMMMVHLPSVGTYGDKNDLKKSVEVLEKIEKSVINIYAEKTGLDEKEISKMLENETWMTAEEAVEKGFADEVDSSIEVTNSITDKVVMFNGISSPISLFKNAPEKILNKLTHVGNKNSNLTNEEEQMNLTEMKEKYPELCSQLVAEAKAEGVKEGTMAERSRMKSLEEMALAGHEEILAKAKFETGISAEQMAVEIVKAEKANREAASRNHTEDKTELTSALAGVQDSLDPNAQVSNPAKDAEKKFDEEFLNAARAELNKGAK